MKKKSNEISNPLWFLDETPGINEKLLIKLGIMMSNRLYQDQQFFNRLNVKNTVAGNYLAPIVVPDGLGLKLL